MCCVVLLYVATTLGPAIEWYRAAATTAGTVAAIEDVEPEAPFVCPFSSDNGGDGEPVEDVELEENVDEDGISDVSRELLFVEFVEFPLL